MKKESKKKIKIKKQEKGKVEKESKEKVKEKKKDKKNEPPKQQPGEYFNIMIKFVLEGYSNTLLWLQHYQCLECQ